MRFSLFSCLLLAVVGYTQAQESTISIARNESIVIVGGGPAGVHYASLLAKKGFTKITLLEASSSLGGKSHTYFDSKGVPHELGTCYAHGLYTPIFNLLQEYDPTNTKIPFVPTIKGHTMVHDDNSAEVVDYNGYISKLVMERTDADTPAEISAAVNAGFRTYIGLHRSIFGTYAYGLPPQPKDWSLVTIPALEFLENNNLMVLEAFFRYVFEQQGYGSLDNTPAFYMLWWIHPDVILKRLQLPTPDSPWVFMLSKGFQSLWKAIADSFSNQVDVQLNSQVTDINRKKDQTLVRVRRPDGSQTTITCGHLIMAVDLSQRAPLPNDLTATEAKLVHSKLTASTFVVSYVQTDALQNETVSEWWPYRGVDSTEGWLQLTRNTRLALFNPLPAHGSPNDPVPTDWGVNATGRQGRVTYQYYNRKAQAKDDSNSGAKLLADLSAAKMTNPVLETQIVYNYAPRFKKLEEGTLWKVWDNQGEKRTTWIGSSVSFESVLDVVTYNNRLIERVQFKDEVRSP